MSVYKIISIVTFAAGIFATTPLVSVEAGPEADANQILATRDMTFEGLLALKEADGVFLVRAQDGKKKRFTVNRNTKITRNGKPATYKDLRSRDRIRVCYTSDFVVTEIHAEGSQGV
jgi:hypothetical protein